MSDNRYYKVRAITLNRFILGEKSRVVEIVSRENGRQKVMVKGSMDSLLLEPLNEGEMVIYNAKGMGYVHTFDVLNYFSGIKESYGRSDTAMKIALDFSKYVPCGFKDTVLFDFLHESLVLIQQVDVARVKQIPVLFKWILAKLMGYTPQLDRCLLCGRKYISRNYFFSVEDGGILCKRCSVNRVDIFPVDTEAVKTLRFILDARDIRIANRVEMRYSIRKLLDELGRRYLDFYIDTGGGK